MTAYMHRLYSQTLVIADLHAYSQTFLLSIFYPQHIILAIKL